MSPSSPGRWACRCSGRVRERPPGDRRGRRGAARRRRGGRLRPARPARSRKRSRPSSLITKKRRAEFAALRDVAAGDHGRRADHGDGQCRPSRRRRRARADRRRRDRPVPHRIPVPRLGDPAEPREPAAALQGGARRGRRQAGHLPHRRRRRRQGACPISTWATAASRRIRRWAGGRFASRSTATG